MSSNEYQRPSAEFAARRVFLLSPANLRGIRAALVLDKNAKCKLALALREHGVPLGEVFSFISGLYFRGKLAYAERFAEVAGQIRPAYIITPCSGLLPSDTLVTRKQLREFSREEVDPENKTYRKSLHHDSSALASLLTAECQIVLLGSVATAKYVEPLFEVFGERLRFPAEFAGRGDMSRGGLMLRCVEKGVQLTYVPVAGAARHGPRPPRLG
jgi:hypothetical protein